MPVTGFYINLASSRDRDVRMRRQLQALSLAARYSRFPAVDGAAPLGLGSARPAGEVGCFLSHYNLLRQNAGSEHLHVLEDDVILSRHAAGLIESIAVPGGVIEKFDIILTDAFVGMHMWDIQHYMKLVAECGVGRIPETGAPADIHVIDISKQKFACTASYLVNRGSIAKICGFLEHEVAATIRSPIDLYLRALANKGHLRIGITVPFITTVPLHHVTPSTIHGPEGDLTRLSMTLIRRALYLDCDAEAALREAAAALPVQGDGRDELIVAAVRLSLSPDFVPL